MQFGLSRSVVRNSIVGPVELNAYRNGVVYGRVIQGGQALSIDLDDGFVNFVSKSSKAISFCENRFSRYELEKGIVRVSETWSDGEGPIVMYHLNTLSPKYNPLLKVILGLASQQVKADELLRELRAKGLDNIGLKSNQSGGYLLTIDGNPSTCDFVANRIARFLSAPSDE